MKKRMTQLFGSLFITCRKGYVSTGKGLDGLELV